MRHLGQFRHPLHLMLIPQAKRPWWKRWRKRRRRFRVLTAFEYRTCDGVPITVPRGTIVDGASIPCFFWRLIGQPMGEYAEASAIHDWLWSVALRRLEHGRRADFAWANAVFVDAMRTLKVAWWRRWLMWAAVSVNGRLVVWRYARQGAKARRGKS